MSAGGVDGDRAFFLVQDDGELISCTDLGDLMRHRAEYDPTSRLLTVHGPEGVLHSDVVELGEPLVTDFFGLRDVSGHVALRVGIAVLRDRGTARTTGARRLREATTWRGSRCSGASSTDALAVAQRR